MKGDLHTLKRVCEYASKVMLAGIFVLAAVFIATLVMSFVAPDLLTAATGLPAPADIPTWSGLWRLLVILILAMFTVWTVFMIMVSIVHEHSPFNERNTASLILLSKIYLVGAAALLILSVLAEDTVANTAFLFFGCILVAVVLYCFGLVVRYGAVLQDESDHTL